MIYLIIILCVICFFAGRLFEFLSNENEREEMDRLTYQKKMLSVWEERIYSLSDYFKNNDIHKIAIYGLGFYYNNFMQKVTDVEFDEIYLSDGNALNKQKEFSEHIYTKQELVNLDFDIVVVTSVAHYLDIKRELSDLGVEKDIISYSDLVYNAMKE